jgi:branched-chain amino acid transport system substrate-binding protein
MTSWITRGVIAAGALWACHGQTQPVVVGAVVSASGAQAQVAEGYRRALLLWEGEVNGRGGLLGRKVELRLRDDASQAVRSGREYEKLIEEKADLLIGPYGSAATLMATSVTERARRVMINGAGPARTVHRRVPRYLFQSATPYAAYGAGVLELSANEGLESVFILSRDDPRSRDMAEATAEIARKRRFVVTMATYGAEPDFAPQVAAARKFKAQAWIAFGEARDAVDMVKTFKRVGYAPALFFARGAAEPGFVAGLGQDAEFSLGATQYDARLGTTGNAAFAKAYGTRWPEKPGAAAAEGYAAATVLEAAVRAAGTLDQEKLRAALAKLEVGTVLGTYKVDPASGVQLGHVPAVTQIRKGVPAPVWPRALETANVLLPYPQWDERTPLK